MGNKRLLIGLMVVLFVLSIGLAGCGGSDTGNGDSDVPTVSVGSKEFTEQLILGQLTIQLLEANGFDVEDNTGLAGSTVARDALVNGDIDMYWEYTGTGLITYLGHEDPITDPQECYETVKDEDLENGITWLDYAPLDNTYTVMMRQSDADELGIHSISDLAEAVNSGVESPAGKGWVFATDHEYTMRDDGLPGLQSLYGFKFDDVMTMDIGITYGALRDGQVPTAMGFATDGRVAGFELVNLEDDQHFHPVYNGSLCVRTEALEKYPEIEEIFGVLTPLLNDTVMTELNAAVDLDGMEPEEAAYEFLLDNDLI